MVILTTSHTRSSSAVAAEVQALNCVQDGIYQYRCKVCGETFEEVVTPEEAAKKGIEVPHAVKKTSGKSEVYVPYLKDDGTLNDGITKADAEYPAGKTVAATIFRPESSEAYCKSCGEPLGFLDQPIEDEEENVSYKLMNGSWVYTAKTNKEAIKIFYIDVTETKKDGLKAVLHTTTLSSNETSSEDSSAIALDTTTLKNGVRMLCLGRLDGTNYLWVSQNETGSWTLKKGANSTYGNAANTFVDLTDEDEDTLKFIESHNHLYGTANSTDAEKKANIVNDQYFEVMTHLGMNYITGAGHYLSCSECGLKYLESNHYIEGNECKVCGGNENYVEVSISEKEDQNVVDALAEVIAASGAATAAASKTTNADTINALTSLVSSLQNAKAALEYVGDTTSSAYTSIVAYLNTGSGATVSNSVAVALSEAKTTSSKVGSDYGTLLTGAATGTSVAVVLGGSNDATYDTSVESKDSVAKILKSAEKLQYNPTSVESFYVEKGTVLPVLFGSYTSFVGKSYTFADNTGWIPSVSGVHLTSEGWEVTDSCTMSFSYSEKGILKK